MNIEPGVLFAALAHDTRLRCMLLLLQHDELCVCEMTHAIGRAQPHLSRHLAQLRETGLVVDRRQGLWIHYRLNPDLPSWAMAVLRDTVRGVRDREPFIGDQGRLATMPDRPGALQCG